MTPTWTPLCYLRNRCDLDFFTPVPITSEHAINTDQLAHTHKDPFDRILLAQAMVEGMTLVTNDRKLATYPGPVRKA